MSGIYYNGTIEQPGVPVVQFLQGNSGGPVSADALDTINIIGSAGILISGNPGTNTLTVTGSSIALNYTNVHTSPYVVLTTDEYLSVDCSSIPIILKFPNAATISQSWIIKDRTGNAQTNNITLTTVGGAVNIDGATTFVMNTQYEALNIIGNNTSYELY